MMALFITCLSSKVQIEDFKLKDQASSKTQVLTGPGIVAVPGARC